MCWFFACVLVFLFACLFCFVLFVCLLVYFVLFVLFVLLVCLFCLIFYLSFFFLLFWLSPLLHYFTVYVNAMDHAYVLLCNLVYFSIKYKMEMYWLDLNQKMFSMWKNPLQIFVDSNENWTSKMAGNIQGRIQDLWLGVVSRRGFWGPLIPPVGPGQSSEGLRNYRHLFERQVWASHIIFISPKKTWLWVLILSDNC